MKLTVIGCAGSFPSPESPASCYLVETDDDAGRTWRVLLDLGNGALGPLQRLVDLHRIDAVLLSHLHADHCIDLLAMFVALRYDPAGSTQRRLPVYGPAGTFDRLVRAYDGDEYLAFDQVFDVREWRDLAAVDIGPLSVTSLRVNHPVEAFGLRVTDGVAVLAYTGDTDACPALVPLARDADLFLAEASFQEGRDDVRGIHLTGLRAGQAAADAGVRRLLLTHLPVWTDAATVLAEARSGYAGPVELARAGAVHEVGPVGAVREIPSARAVREL